MLRSAVYYRGNTLLIICAKFAGHCRRYGQFRKFNYVLFTEIARSASGGNGGIIGLVSNLNRNLEASILARKYDNNFHSFYSSGFSESTRNMGEEGIYTGLKYSFNQKLILTTFFDGFRFTGVRSNISRPSVGFEYLSRLTYRPNKKALFYVQFRHQSKADNIAGESLNRNIKRVGNAEKSNYLINLDYEISPIVSIKSRIQGSYQIFDGNFSDGFALVQDINLNYRNWRLSSRIALFDTDNFDNSQYIYERDVLYAFSIPSLNGRGIRNYLVLRFKASQKLDFWMKYSRSSFVDRKVIGSGLEEIDDNKRTVLRIQSRIRF